MTLYSKTRNNTFLDAMATALSVMPHTARMNLLEKLSDISYLFVTNDAKVYKSKDIN